MIAFVEQSHHGTGTIFTREVEGNVVEIWKDRRIDGNETKRTIIYVLKEISKFEFLVHIHYEFVRG
jgi:hypothetical protein